MSQVLFLSSPESDVNPILDLASELISQGEKVTFFSAAEFKQPVENIGADFKAYQQSQDIFKPTEDDQPKSGLITALLNPMKFIDDILVQIRELKFDYAVIAPAYPYANLIIQALGIKARSISSV